MLYYYVYYYLGPYWACLNPWRGKFLFVSGFSCWFWLALVYPYTGLFTVRFCSSYTSMLGERRHVLTYFFFLPVTLCNCSFWLKKKSYFDSVVEHNCKSIPYDLPCCYLVFLLWYYIEAPVILLWCRHIGSSYLRALMTTNASNSWKMQKRANHTCQSGKCVCKICVVLYFLFIIKVVTSGWQGSMDCFI